MIGNAVKLLRVRKGLTQTELAKLTNVSLSYISSIEKGRRNPSFSKLQKIAEALDKPLFLVCYLAESNSDDLPRGLKEKLMYEAMK